MCNGGAVQYTPSGGTRRRPSVNLDALEAMQVADEETYGIRRSNPLESDEDYFERIAETRQAEADALASKRRSIARQQVQRRDELEAQRAASLAATQAEVERLQKIQEDRLAAMSSRQAELTAEAEQSMKQAMAAGQAVSSSLGILSNFSNKQGRTAAVTRARSRSRGGRRTTASLSLGQTGRSGGSGSNLSI